LELLHGAPFLKHFLAIGPACSNSTHKHPARLLYYSIRSTLGIENDSSVQFTYFNRLHRRLLTMLKRRSPNSVICIDSTEDDDEREESLNDIRKRLKGTPAAKAPSAVSNPTARREELFL
jgi:hypothetical protein